MFKIKAIEGLKEAMDEKVEEAAQFAFTKSQEIMIKNGTVDTGFLLSSGDVVRSGWCRRELVYNCPYASDIEYGSDPHWVPPGELEGWARRKLKLSPKEAKLASIRISGKIFKFGTEPQPFIRPAIEQTRKKFGWAGWLMIKFKSSRN